MTQNARWSVVFTVIRLKLADSCQLIGETPLSKSQLDFLTISLPTATMTLNSH